MPNGKYVNFLVFFNMNTLYIFVHIYFLFNEFMTFIGERMIGAADVASGCLEEALVKQSTTDHDSYSC